MVISEGALAIYVTTGPYTSGLAVPVNKYGYAAHFMRVGPSGPVEL